MNFLRPILVTGIPRSGTTWIGRMIAQSQFVRYIHEPFNISNPPCHCGMNFTHRYYYLSPKDVNQFYDHLNHTIYPAYNWVGFMNFLTGLLMSKRVRSSVNYLKSYLSCRPLIKDPIAVFSAGTLADLFSMEVIVIIRHPAAVVNSYKNLNWRVPFSHFLNQPELLEEHLTPYRHEIENFANHEYDIVDQVALLWKLIHYRIIKYQETQPNWIFVRYEDLALEPIEGFRKIFKQVKLPFSERTSTLIQTHSLREQPSNTKDPYAIKQNPRQVVSKWREKLTATEIARIRERVEEVSSGFFPDNQW